MDVPPIQIHIAPDTHVFDSSQLDDVINMVEYMLDGGRPTRADKAADHGDANDTAIRRHPLDRFVSFAANAARDESPAVGMSHEYRFSRSFDCLHGGSVAAVRNIHGHAHLVHPLDDLRAVRS